MNKKSKKKQDIPRGKICADCGKTNMSVYGKRLGQSRIMFVCWSCFNK